MLLSKDGAAINLDWDDEILQGSVLTHEGQIPNERVRQMLEGGQS